MEGRVMYLFESEKGLNLPDRIYEGFMDYLSSIEREVKSSALGTLLSKKGKEVEERFGHYMNVDRAVFGALVDFRGIILSLLSYLVSSIRGGGVAGESFPLLMGSASIGKTYILTNENSPLVRLLRAAGVYINTILPKSLELSGQKIPSLDKIEGFGKVLYKVVETIPGYFEGVGEGNIKRGDVLVVMDECFEDSL